MTTVASVSVADILVADDPGFACSKSKLVSDGLLHLRPFNIEAEGGLTLIEVYRVPRSVAPRGRAVIESGDILFNNTNSPDLVGKSALVASQLEAGFSNHLSRLRVDRSRVIPAWFYYWLRHKAGTGFFTQHATRWVSQAAFKTSELRRIRLELPTVEEQRRVVGLLSRAENIIRMRREAEQKAKEIIPALFLDMFGDPATNPKGWGIARLGDVAEVVSGVAKGRKLGGRATREVPYMRVANVQAGHLNLNEMKRIPATEAEITELALQRGDVLLTEGGDHDKLGRGALLDIDIGECIHQNHVFRVRASQASLVPEYFAAFLQTDVARHYFLKSAKKTTNLASINMTQLRALPVVLPPVNLQRQFAGRASQTKILADDLGQGARLARQALESVLSGVFSERRAT